MDARAQENAKWQTLLNKFVDISFFYKFDEYLDATPQGVLELGQAGTIRRGNSGVQIWLNVIRNQYTNRLKFIGKVLSYWKSEAEMALFHIREQKLEKLFGIGGNDGYENSAYDAQPQIPAKQIYTSSHIISSPYKADPVLGFFRRGCMWVDPSVEDKTVKAQLEKVKDFPLMQVLGVNSQSSVVDWLYTYPDAIFLVGIALIKYGLSDPYSEIDRDKRSIIQYKLSMEDMAEGALKNLINNLPIIRLARFCEDSKQDDFYSKALFSGVDMEDLKKLLIYYGKRKNEIEYWDANELIECVIRWVDNVESKTQYKLDVLCLLRDHGHAPTMIPWLTVEELEMWLNPPVAKPKQIIYISAPTPVKELSDLEKLMEKAKINKPQFVKAYEGAGYDCDLLKMVLKELNNPKTKEILSLLTDPERLKLLKAYRDSTK